MIDEPSLRTNRDLYLFVAALSERHRGAPRPLEAWLRALLALTTPWREHEALPLPRFAQLLEAALTEPPAPFDPAWGAATVTARTDGSVAGYARWHAELTAQVADLRAMAAVGTLADPDRNFGVDAPSGARWYNFEPLQYLECGVTGCLGGWEPDDRTGRVVVPGPVVVLGDDGTLTACDPAEIQRAVFDLPEVGWDLFAELLICGRLYE